MPFFVQSPKISISNVDLTSSEGNLGGVYCSISIPPSSLPPPASLHSFSQIYFHFLLLIEPKNFHHFSLSTPKKKKLSKTLLVLKPPDLPSTNHVHHESPLLRRRSLRQGASAFCEEEAARNKNSEEDERLIAANGATRIVCCVWQRGREGGRGGLLFAVYMDIRKCI